MYFQFLDCLVGYIKKNCYRVCLLVAKDLNSHAGSGATSPGPKSRSSMASQPQKANTIANRSSGAASSRRSTYSYDHSKSSSTEKTNVSNLPDSARYGGSIRVSCHINISIKWHIYEAHT